MFAINSGMCVSCQASVVIFDLAPSTNVSVTELFCDETLDDDDPPAVVMDAVEYVAAAGAAADDDGWRQFLSGDYSAASSGVGSSDNLYDDVLDFSGVFA